MVHFPILQEADSCKDIVFESGASVGKIQNLVYREPLFSTNRLNSERGL